VTPEERRRLARVGTAMIALGGAVVILATTAGTLGSVGWPPGIIIVVLGVIFVAMSTGVHRGELTLGSKRAAFDLTPQAPEDDLPARSSLPAAAHGAEDEQAGERLRRRRQCRLLSRSRD
jgi:hypothetical protein